MEEPTYLPDTAFSQGQQSSSDPPSPSSSQVNAEASPERGTVRHVCPVCRRSYAQRQGFGRHIRTAHNPNRCLLCEFKWGRRYEYRNHLRKKHPGVDPDMILGKAPGSRRRATILTEHLPQQPLVAHPAVEQDRKNWTESQPYPSASLSPAGARDTAVFPPAVSHVGYNPQAVSAEQTITMDENEYGHGSKFPDTIYPLAMLPSTEERAKPMNGLDKSRDGQFRLPSGGATHSPSNPETAPIPTFSPESPPIRESYSAPVTGNPVVEPYGLIRYPPFSDADYDAIFSSATVTNPTF